MNDKRQLLTSEKIKDRIRTIEEANQLDRGEGGAHPKVIAAELPVTTMAVRNKVEKMVENDELVEVSGWGPKNYQRTSYLTKEQKKRLYPSDFPELDLPEGHSPAKV
ncbi:MAG: hypothetical protein ABEK59_04800 [Halobacteria archaeon]